MDEAFHDQLDAAASLALNQMDQLVRGTARVTEEQVSAAKFLLRLHLAWHAGMGSDVVLDDDDDDEDDE